MLYTFMAVMDERGQKGIRDEAGKEASPMPFGLDRDKYGEEIRARLSGKSVSPGKSGYQVFAPAIDAFLKEHLFADIFWRDNLDILSREVATVAALCSLDGVDPMLQFHMGASLNVGLTEAAMSDLLAIVETKVGKKEAENARQVFARVLSTR